MRVGYKKLWGVLMVGLAAALGAMLLLSGSFARMDVSFYGPALAATSSFICGICYLVRPYFEVASDRITVYALLGPLRREYLFGSNADLRIHGGRLFVRGQKVPISRGQADAADWGRFLARIGIR